MKNFDVELPRVLNGQLQTDYYVHPLTLSLNLTMTPLSYASMSLPVGESVQPRSYVELFSPYGSAGIFRVRAPQDAYGNDFSTAELEHAIVEVGDYVITAEYNEMMPATTAMRTVFSHYRGNRWQLGDVSALGVDSVAVDFNYDRVLDAMISLLDQRPNCYLTFNFDTTPWTVSIATRDATVSAEGRLARNVNSAKVTYDDTELCTRVYYEHASTTDSLDGYPVFDANANYSSGHYLTYGGKLYRLTASHTSGTSWENTSKEAITDIPSSAWAHIDADTIDQYGIVERSVPTSSDFTEAEALKAANEYLRKHKKPRVSIEISAEELSYVTGEPFDRFTIGKLFRLALPDYNTTVENHVTGLSWADVYNMPDNLTVSLADEEDTTVTFLHDMDASGGSGGGGGGRKKQDDTWKEYRTKIDMDDKHIELWARHFDEIDRILQQAGVYIDSDGVIVYADDNERMWASHLQVQSDRISLVVEGQGDNARIKSAEIVGSINDSGSTVKISADHIDIDGILSVLITTLDTLVPQSGTISVTGDMTVGGDLGAGGLTLDDGYIMMGEATLTLAPYDAGWIDKTVVTGVNVTFPSYTMTGRHSFAVADADLNVTGRYAGNLITGSTAGSVNPSTTTIHYLGRS